MSTRLDVITSVASIRRLIEAGRCAGLFAKVAATKSRPESRFHAGRRAMFVTKALARLTICAGLMALPGTVLTSAYGQQTVTVGTADIGGTVVSAAGPEAGVWVIAETTDLPTKFARIVVTDDQGRYLVPDLPSATYAVWVRGYGLADSSKLTAKPGQVLNHTAVPAPDEAAAAHYYPAIYWYAMMTIPPVSEFGGNSSIPEKLTQNDWLKQMKNIGCIGCHQLGQESTRTIPAAFGKFDSGEAAWMRRVQSGQSGEQMVNQLAGNFGGAPFKYLGDWTDRVAKGELPKQRPPRSPVDGSIWYTVGVFGGPPAVLRFDPATGLSEVFNVPAPAFGIRGGDIDKNGVVWASLSSGHLGSFDRRKCKGPLNGPTATGNHCPEGWTIYQYPGPGFEGIGENSAESSYYTWVDQHNTFGLGENIPMSTANLSDGFVALKDGKMITIRIPYPLSFYAKGFDGRIDDPNAGWKGRGLWSTNGDRTPWLKEGGKGSMPRAVHIQLRPDPLAN